MDLMTDPTEERPDLSEQIVVRVTPPMRAWLQAEADSGERTVSQQVRYLIRQHLEVTP
jgi:hypothetical protein